MNRGASTTSCAGARAGRAIRAARASTSALEDPLLRIFAGERINRIMVMLKMPEGEPIEHRMVSRSLESAQRKVEARNFDIRKQLLEYDDVANDQSKTIYALRNELLESQDVSARIADLRLGCDRRPVPPVRSRGERRGAVGHRRPRERAQGRDRARAAAEDWLQKEPELGDEGLARAHHGARRRSVQGEDP
jgi:preprotein translocase subunit SecA